MTCDRLEREGFLEHLGEEMDPHVTQCDDCRARRDEYHRLTAMLAQESVRPLPAGWKERTMARWERHRTARRRRIAAYASAAAAAAAVLVFIFIPPTKPVEFGLSIERGDGAYRAVDVVKQGHPGDRIVVVAPTAAAPHTEVRIYLNSREVVARCPGGSPPACRTSDDKIELALPASARGSYEVLFLRAPSPLPEPTGSLEADLDAARKVGAKAEVERALID